MTVMVLTGEREGMVVGSEQTTEPPNGDAILNSLWSAMAFPLPTVSERVGKRERKKEREREREREREKTPREK